VHEGAFDLSGRIVLPDAGEYLLALRGADAGAGGVRSYAFVTHGTLDTAPVPLAPLQTGPGPNLVPDAPALDGPAVAGGSATLRWMTRNTGTEPAPTGFDERLVIRNRDTGAVLVDVLIPYSGAPLAAGAGVARSHTFALPDGSAGAGAFEAVLTTDAGGVVAERDFDGTAESDNALTFLFTAAVPAFPNLAVDEILPPAQADWLAGGSVAFGWRVTNSGSAPASGAWTERLVLRDRATGNVVASAEVVNAAPLVVGGTALRSVDLPVPPGTYGSYDIEVILDAEDTLEERADGVNAEADNQAARAFHASADLAVADFELVDAGSARRGEDVVLRYRVTNSGGFDMPAGTDRLEIRTGQFGFAVAVIALPAPALAAGQSMLREVTVPLAATLPDEVFLVLRVNADADSTRLVPEVGQGGGADLSNTASLFIYPEAALRADLEIVAAPVLPPSVRTGEVVRVTWAVTNAGAATTEVDAWIDSLRLFGPGLGGAGLELARAPHSGALAPGAGYAGQADLVIPGGLAVGAYSLRVVNDANAALEEPRTRANNTSPAATLQITAPQADLSVPSVIATPDRLFAGGTIDVTWRVENAGPEDVGAGFTDRIYATTTGTLAGAVLLAEVVSGTGIAAGAGLVRSATLSLPAAMTGLVDILVRTDALGVVAEGDTANNTGRLAAPLAVAARPAADLVVTLDAAPARIVAGQPFELGYTVTNAGSVAALAPWVDAIDLRHPVTGALVMTLGSVQRGLSLQPGDSYSDTLTLVAPASLGSLEGSYRLSVRTDIADRVFEAGLIANNRADSDPLIFGAGDLVVRSLVADRAQASAGDTLRLDWQVENIGAIELSGPRTDRIWLSRTPTRAADAVLLAEVAVPAGLLVPGASGAAQADVTLPEGSSGALFLIVEANTPANLPEGGRGANNARALALEVAALPAPDLTVADLVAPDLLIGAQVRFDVTWSVRNDGPGAGLAPGWQDEVRLVPVAGGQPIVLGRFARLGPLDPGASYTRTESFAVQNLFGDFRLEVVADAGGAVFQGDGAAPDTASRALGIAERAFADLAVVSVSAPATASGGDTIALSWRVENHGSVAAPLAAGGGARLADRVEIRNAATGALLFSDIFDQVGQLLPGGGYDRTAQITLPGFADGA
jgi:hypothetical protein